MLTQFLKLWLHFSKLYTQNHNTHTQHTNHHTHLAKANTSFKTILTLLKMVSLRRNSTHKHKIISHIHANVKNVKHCSCVFFACSECSGVHRILSYHLQIHIISDANAHIHIHCIYSVYAPLRNFTQLCKLTESLLN